MNFTREFKRLYEFGEEFNELSEGSKKLLRNRARRQAAVLGFALVSSLVSVVYAYVQKEMVDKLGDLAERTFLVATEQRNRADLAESITHAAKEEARRQQNLAETERGIAQEMSKGLLAELNKCQKRRSN